MILQYEFLSLNEKCVTLEIGQYIPEGRVLLVYDVQLFQRRTLYLPTYPDLCPNKGSNTGPTSEPITRIESPNTTIIGRCTLVGDAPFTISAGSILLHVANMALYTLGKSVPSPEGGEVTLISIARSYKNNQWEQATRDYAASIFDGVNIECYTMGYQLNLLALEVVTKYILSSSSHLSESNEHARFLETATFGVMQEQLDVFVDSPNSVQDDITNCICEEMNSSRTLMTSRKEYWKKSVIHRARRGKELIDSVGPMFMLM